MSREGGFDDANYDRGMEELMKEEKDENGEFTITEWTEVHETFDTMNLKENLLRGIYAYGFEKPSAIQQRGIVPFSKGFDVIQQAQSGTGKTATFCAGILQSLDYNITECQALVLAPTRESWRNKLKRSCARWATTFKSSATRASVVPPSVKTPASFKPVSTSSSVLRVVFTTCFAAAR